MEALEDSIYYSFFNILILTLNNRVEKGVCKAKERSLCRVKKGHLAAFCPDFLFLPQCVCQAIGRLTLPGAQHILKLFLIAGMNEIKDAVTDEFQLGEAKGEEESGTQKNRPGEGVGRLEAAHPFR